MVCCLLRSCDPVIMWLFWREIIDYMTIFTIYFENLWSFEIIINIFMPKQSNNHRITGSQDHIIMVCCLLWSYDPVIMWLCDYFDEKLLITWRFNIIFRIFMPNQSNNHRIIGGGIHDPVIICLFWHEILIIISQLQRFSKYIVKNCHVIT